MQRLLTIVLWMIPALAVAQDSVELSDTQRSYNEKGVTAIREGEYAAAISSFESSLTLGEANITYLNLGRAYQRDGQCMNAKRAYKKVADAPIVSAPSRDEVLKVLDKYASELPDLCPATVRVVCDDPQTTITVDGGEPQPCTAALGLELSPGGAHKIVGRLGQKRVIETVEPAEGEEVDVVIEFPAEESPPPPKKDPPPKDPDAVVVPPAGPTDSGGMSTLRTIGLVTGAIGAAAVTTGLVMDYVYVKPAVEPCWSGRADPKSNICSPDALESARSAKTVNSIVLATGGGLVIGGLILYLAGGSSDSGVSLQYDDGPGIAWKAHF